MRVPIALLPSQCLVLSGSRFGHSSGYQMVSFCCFNLFFPGDDEVEYLHMCLFGIYACSLVTCLLRSLSHIKIGCLFSCWVLRVLAYLSYQCLLFLRCVFCQYFFLSLWLVFLFPWKLRLSKKSLMTHVSLLKLEPRSSSLPLLQQRLSERLLYGLQGYKHLGSDWTKQLPASIRALTSGLISLTWSMGFSKATYVSEVTSLSHFLYPHLYRKQSARKERGHICVKEHRHQEWKWQNCILVWISIFF